MKKKNIIIVIVCVLVLLIGIGSCSTGGNEQTTNSTESQDQTKQEQQTTEETTWDANTDLFGMTVESAWDEIENKGYSIGSIVSITGAELNSDESIRHSSTAQTWLVSKAEVDDKSKTVTIEVTSHDQFVDEFGKEFVQ